MYKTRKLYNSQLGKIGGAEIFQMCCEDVKFLTIIAVTVKLCGTWKVGHACRWYKSTDGWNPLIYSVGTLLTQNKRRICVVQISHIECRLHFEIYHWKETGKQSRHQKQRVKWTKFQHGNNTASWVSHLLIWGVLFILVSLYVNRKPNYTVGSP